MIGQQTMVAQPANHIQSWKRMGQPLSSASGRIELMCPWHHKLASVKPVVGFSLSPVDCLPGCWDRLWGWGRPFSR
ncbi:hypothetical protein N7513_008398 [Penicillium frequentans]|nr:hypothetical protein N7513_008398 [Penicillium glabrum]